MNGWKSRKADFEKRNPGKRMKPPVFGGRKNLVRYLKKQISKDEFRKFRLRPVTIAGETRHKGNRLFNLDIADCMVTFKPKKGILIPVKFAASKKQKAELLKMQELCLQNRFSVAISLDNEHVSFCYDEIKLSEGEHRFDGLKKNRVLGIDQNPNYVGISVIEFDGDGEFEVLHKQAFDLSRLTKKSGKPPWDKTSKYLVNKRRHETVQVAYAINRIMKNWRCGMLVAEDLNFRTCMQAKGLNRLCMNTWDRKLLENKLKMLSGLHGYEFVEVNPCYSSIVGNVLYGDEYTPDMVAASIEIGRRGYRKFEKGWFYPDFGRSLSQMNEQWKQTSAGNSVGDWKGLFSLIKNSKLKYRVFLD